ncbi:hypothetical protein [Streptomyces halstedii]|uniref:hypothetical protein n=1 Tax=Streptomyces halstedii TaxID=1944 RepID=UPI003358835C
MGITFIGAVQFWIPTAVVCAAVAVWLARRRRGPGLPRPSSVAALGVVAFLNAATAWVLGLSRAGLDLREACERKAGVPLDDAWNAHHYEQSQKVFPLHARCDATVDLVPAWINPLIVVLLLLTAVCLCTAVCLGARNVTRRRKKAHV